MRKTTVLLAIALWSQAAWGQEFIPITKAEVLERVKQNNITLKITREDIEAARGEFNQANAIFLPNITASHTAMATTNPLMAFGIKLNQETLTPGDFDPAKLNDPSQIQDYATRIEVEQPLINVDGIVERKAAKYQWRATQLQGQRTAEHVMLEIEKAYMQLQLAYHAVDILETAVATAEENKRLAQNSFDQGLIQRSDVLAVEVHVTEVLNRLQYAHSNIGNASNYLSVLMGDDDYAILKPTDSLTVANPPVEHRGFSIGRADIRAMEMSVEARESMARSAKYGFLPRLNAFGSYELHDNEIFRAGADGYLFGARLSWDILQGGRRFGKTKQSLAEHRKSQLEYDQYVAKNRIEFAKAERELENAKNKLELTKLAVEQAGEALRIRQNRFEEGLERTSDLLNSETMYAQKRLEYLQSIYTYNYALAYLDFLTQE